MSKAIKRRIPNCIGKTATWTDSDGDRTFKGTITEQKIILLVRFPNGSTGRVYKDQAKITGTEA